MKTPVYHRIKNIDYASKESQILAVSSLFRNKAKFKLIIKNRFYMRGRADCQFISRKTFWEVNGNT